MKTKTSKQPKQSKPTVQLKDIKPAKNPKGGVATGVALELEVDTGYAARSAGRR